MKENHEAAALWRLLTSCMWKERINYKTYEPLCNSCASIYAAWQSTFSRSVLHNKMKVANLAEVARDKWTLLFRNRQMKSFIGTANMMPARAPGEKGGAEQHRPRLRKRAGHMGRKLSCAKSLDNCLATGRAWPSSSSSLKLLVSLLWKVFDYHYYQLCVRPPVSAAWFSFH